MSLQDALFVLIGPVLWTLGLGAFWLGFEGISAIFIIVGAIFFAWMYSSRYRTRT